MNTLKKYAGMKERQERAEKRQNEIELLVAQFILAGFTAVAILAAVYYTNAYFNN